MYIDGMMQWAEENAYLLSYSYSKSRRVELNISVVVPLTIEPTFFSFSFCSSASRDFDIIELVDMPVFLSLDELWTEASLAEEMLQEELGLPPEWTL